MDVDIQKLLATVPWKERYQHIQEVTRYYLSRLDGPDTLTTRDLVEQIIPEQSARGDEIEARKNFMSGLLAMAPNALSDCAYKGKEIWSHSLRKMIKPWVWHYPTGEMPVPCCSKCGQPLKQLAEGS